MSYKKTFLSHLHYLFNRGDFQVVEHLQHGSWEISIREIPLLDDFLMEFLVGFFTDVAEKNISPSIECRYYWDRDTAVLVIKDLLHSAPETNRSPEPRLQMGETEY